MKIPFILATAATLLTHALAEVSPIRMEVRQNVKVESKGKSNDTKDQDRSLTIDLQNNSNEPMNDLIVKYWFFARDMKSHDNAILKLGERKASLAPRGKETVETEAVSSTYTNAHTETERSKNHGNKRGNDTRVRRVEASGKRISGYAVKVMNGGSVVAEYYSEPSLKALATQK